MSDPMYELSALRAMNDCYAPVRGEESTDQKRLKAFAFFRGVERMSLVKAMKMAVKLHPRKKLS